MRCALRGLGKRQEDVKILSRDMCSACCDSRFRDHRSFVGRKKTVIDVSPCAESRMANSMFPHLILTTVCNYQQTSKSNSSYSSYSLQSPAFFTNASFAWPCFKSLSRIKREKKTHIFLERDLKQVHPLPENRLFRLEK